MAESGLYYNEILSIISNVMIFFVIAGLVVPVLQKFRISLVLAYLICGIAVGPQGLVKTAQYLPFFQYFSIKDSQTVSLFGEFGIIALMFMIGLELSLKRLKELRLLVFGVGSGQIILSGLLIAFLARALGYPLNTAILLGASLALSSTAIVMYLLEEKRLTNQNVGVLSFSILLMQDLAVVPILILVASLSPYAQESPWFLMVRSLAIAFAAVILIYIIGKWLLRPVLNLVSGSRNPEWLVAFMMMVVMGCVMITINTGLSAALGAFLAGLLIGETELRYEVEIIIAPLKSMFLGVFFISIGMMIDINSIFINPLMLVFWVSALFIIKATGAFVVSYFFGMPKHTSLQGALYLAHPGEFALLVISVAMSSGAINPQDGQFFLLATTLSMFTAPMIFPLAPLIVKKLAPMQENSQNETIVSSEKMVIIAGFGRIGQILGNILEEQRLPYIAIDNNPERVRHLQKLGYRVVYGDAKKINLWNLIKPDAVLAAVITVDEQHSARAILKSIHAKWPLLPTIIRANDLDDVDRMMDLGAKFVVPETLESSLRMARLLMSELGLEQESIEASIQQIWQRSSYLK